MFIFIDHAMKLKLFITSLMAGDFNKSCCKIPGIMSMGGGEAFGPEHPNRDQNCDLHPK